MTTDRQRAANRENARKSTGPRTRAGKASSSSNARQHGLTGALPHKDVVNWYRVIVNDGGAVPDPFETDPCLLAAANLARAEAQLQRIKDAQETWWSSARGRSSEDVPSPESEGDAEDDLEWVFEAVEESAVFERPFKLAQEGRYFAESFPRPSTFEDFYKMLAQSARNPRVGSGLVVARSNVSRVTVSNVSRVTVGEPNSRVKLLRRIDQAIDRHSLARRVADQKQGAHLDRYRSSAEATRHTALRRWISEIAKRTQSSQARDRGTAVTGSSLSAT